MAKPARTRATRATPLAPASNVIPFPATVRARNRQRRHALADALALVRAHGWRFAPPCASDLLDAYLNTSEYGRQSLLVAAKALRTNFPSPH